MIINKSLFTKTFEEKIYYMFQVALYRSKISPGDQDLQTFKPILTFKFDPDTKCGPDPCFDP